MRRLLVGSLVSLLVVPVAWTTQPAWAAGPFAPDPSWQTDALVRSIAYSKSTMYIGGEFTHMRPKGAAPDTGEVSRNHVAAISLTTGNLRAWKPNVDGIVYAIEVVGSTVYLGGSFSSVNGVARRNLAAVDRTSGDLLRWRPRADDTVREIQLGPEGTLFLGGRFTTIDGKTRRHIAEITTGGKLRGWAPMIGQISGFPCPPRCPPNVLTIAFSVGGRIVYFGGHFGTVNGTPRREVAAVRIDDDEALRAWDPDPYADANCPTCTTQETSRVYNLIVTKDKAYMCGGFWRVRHGTTNAYNVLVTDLTSGAPDSTFAVGDDGDTLGCALHRGVLYLGGHFDYAGAVCSQNPPRASTRCTAANSTYRQHVVAVDATTGEILPWNPAANSIHGVATIERGPGVVGIGGYFTQIGGSVQQGIAMYQSRLA
jgi:hypothetical protein